MDLRQSIFKARTTAVPATEDPSETKGLEPLPWSDYFETKTKIKSADTVFNVYATGLTNTAGPVFMFHHGA
ncbi:hypothetical protein LPJ75_002911, partial [Coemansia sp. RSA 2598]